MPPIAPQGGLKTLTRREWMAGLGAAVMAAPSAAEPSEDAGLAHRMGSALLLFQVPGGRALPPGSRVEIAQTRSKFLFGCNLFRFEEMNNAEAEKAYREQFAGLFNYATIPVYWPMVEPHRGELALGRQDRMVKWCGQHGIAVKGHALAYNNRDPEWLPEDPAEVQKLLLAHIRALIERYRETVPYWDVVNEAVRCTANAEKRASAPHMTAAIERMGVRDYLRECFAAARRANPSALLAINEAALGDAFADDVLSQMDPRSYDIIGMQAHQHDGAWTPGQIEKPCRRLGRFEKQLHFTEVTLVSGKLQSRKASSQESWDTTPEGEMRQSHELEHFYTTAFAQPGVSAITWWDFSDFQAWKGAPAGLVRSDMSPKPAYAALKRLIHQKWTTRLSTETELAGTARFRGFLGSYRADVYARERIYHGEFDLERESTLIQVHLT